MLTSKQISFCKQIANGKNATEAYQIAFKNSNATTCKTNGSKLLKQAEIAKKIEAIQSQNAGIIAKANEIAAEKLAAGEIADNIERQKVLTQIMRGDTKIRADKFFYDSKAGEVITQEVEELPDHQARIKAIAELNKMDGSYAATKIDATVGCVKSIIIERASKTKG